MSTSLTHRKDIRSTEQFAKDIEYYTILERHWFENFKQDLELKGYKCGEIIDIGVDNNGNLIEKQLPKYSVDKQINIDGMDFKFEVKTIPPNCPCFTFKKTSLEICQEHFASIFIPKPYIYYIIPPQTIYFILRNMEAKIYRNFSPNDLSIRINANQIKDLVDKGMIEKYTWEKQTCEIAHQIEYGINKIGTN